MENSTTGERLAKLREQKNITQKELAEHLGISSPAIVAYEHNRSRPVRVLNKLAEYYNVSVDYLLGLADSPLPKEVNINTLSDTEKQLIFDFRSLNNKGKEKIIQYIADIIELPSYTEKEKVISA